MMLYEVKVERRFLHTTNSRIRTLIVCATSVREAEELARDPEVFDAQTDTIVRIADTFASVYLARG
ncbi:MAG: hypothetical protein MN733_24760 [Nitrososphaera sp.]|nr:hypothetical protein [Nitrososphaera sp.]